MEVLTGKPNYPQGKLFPGYKTWGCVTEAYRGAKVNRIPLRPRGRGGLGLALNYLFFVFSGLFVAPFLLRKKKFDVIFVYAPSPILQAVPAIFLGFLKGCPVVLWVQDLWPESLSATGFVPNKMILKLVEWIVRFIYKHCDLILVQSPGFVDPVRKLASDTPIEYYPNSVSELFSASTASEVPIVEGMDAVFSVLFAGNIGQAQAVEVIVEAALLLNNNTDIQFVVMGDGSARQWMLDEVQQKSLTNLHLPGRFPLESMPGFMEQASALLVTLADREIFAATVPSKVQAYMAAGKPIIACLNGEGARLVEQAGAGLAAPAEDARALADKVLELYGAPAGVLQGMGANGRQYYQQHFDHSDLIDQLIGHFTAMAQAEDGT